MRRFLSLALSVACLAAPAALGDQPSEPADVIRVACLGDSITFGARTKDRAVESYPARLQTILGKDYEVHNLGIGGATLIQPGRPTAWRHVPTIVKLQPQVIVVLLGTNDTVGAPRRNWERIDRFVPDFQAMIDQFAALDSQPNIFVATPTAMVLTTPDLSADRLANLRERKPRLQDLCRRIRQLAADNQDKSVQLLELNNLLPGHPDWITPGDGVHPTPAGYKAIAQRVAEAIKKAAEE